MARMIAQVEATASRPRSAGPAVRIDGAPALTGLVRSFGLDARPARGYVEEIVDHFRALPLTPEHLAQVEELDVSTADQPVKKSARA